MFNAIITCVLQEIDINKCSVSELDFTSDFTLHIHQTSSVTAIVGSFDAYFGYREENQVTPIQTVALGVNVNVWRPTCILSKTN